MAYDNQRAGYSGGNRTREQARPAQQAAPSTAGAGAQAPALRTKQKLFDKFGEKFGIDSELLVETLKATCFRQANNAPPITNEQLVALLIVADQYGLNPFTKEIYAYPDKNGGIVPVVSVDGWIRIINSHEQVESIEIVHSEKLVEHPSGEHKPCFEWIEVTIKRRDRTTALPVIEYFDEVYRPPIQKTGNDNRPYTIKGPWQTHTKRLMRHKGIIQSGRVTLGFSGIYDEDEAQRIIEDQSVVATVPPGQTRTEAAKEALRAKTGQATAPASGKAIPGGSTLSGGTAQQGGQPATNGDQRNDRVISTQQGGKEVPPWDAPIEGSPEPKATPTPKFGDAGCNDFWIKAAKACTTIPMVDVAWDDVIDAYMEAPEGVPIEVESVYQLKRELLGEQA